jgi:saccharopine dehydrogenase (NAD+, L-lysine forming)
MKIGIIRETMSHEDPRVALTPLDARKLMDHYTGLEIVVQSSPKRIFSNQEYEQLHIPVVEEVDDCDCLIGVKEVAIRSIIPGKKYLFFAHVAKQQTKQQRYFRELIRKKITLIDYEYLIDTHRRRIIAFGYWAGIAGCYYAIHALMKKLGFDELPKTDELDDISTFNELLQSGNFPPIKFLISGSGQTSKGAEQVLHSAGIRKISPQKFLQANTKPVYTIVRREHHIVDQEGKAYRKQEYQNQPENYHSILNRFAACADVYLACHYWEQGYPVFLNSDDLRINNHSLKVVADISCDIPGPLACTLRESSHDEPYYDYDPEKACIAPAFSSEKNLTVMSIGNLPAKLPRVASIHFSSILHREILPSLISNEHSPIIDRATILDQGKLTAHFNYLYKYQNQPK